MARTERIELRWTPELLAKVDAARGDVSRNRFIERAVEMTLAHDRFGDEVGTLSPAIAEQGGTWKRPSYVKPFKPAPKKGK